MKPYLSAAIFTKMSTNRFCFLLGVVLLLILSQKAHCGSAKAAVNSTNEFRGFVTVNDTKYWIDTTPIHRDEAQAECESRDMNLISFQTNEKYEDTIQWLYDNGHEYDWMWCGALKEANSSTWIWEPTGEEISVFQWAADEPTVNDNSIRTCVSFSVWSVGWDDDDCSEYFLGYICE